MAGLSGCVSAENPPEPPFDDTVAEFHETLDEAQAGGDPDLLRRLRLRLDALDKESPGMRAAILSELPRFERLPLSERREVAMKRVESDSEEMVRYEALRALIAMRGAEAREACRLVLTARDRLTGLLAESAPEVRAEAARGLGVFAAEDDVAVLVATLEDPVPWVRVHAQLALMKIAGGEKAETPAQWKSWYERRYYERRR